MCIEKRVGRISPESTKEKLTKLKEVRHVNIKKYYHMTEPFLVKID